MLACPRRVLPHAGAADAAGGTLASTLSVAGPLLGARTLPPLASSASLLAGPPAAALLAPLPPLSSTVTAAASTQQTYQVAVYKSALFSEPSASVMQTLSQGLGLAADGAAAANGAPL